MDKAIALQLAIGNYDASVRLSNEAKKGLSCRITNVGCLAFSILMCLTQTLLFYTDSDTLGWGVTDRKNPSGGRWRESR